MSADAAYLGPRLARYLAERRGDDAPIEIRDLRRIAGGASRRTYRFTERAGQVPDASERGLVLRLDPPSSLIETERAAEFRALQAFHGTDVPTPRPLYLETDAPPLGAPFFVMEEVPDAHADAALLSTPAFAPHRETLGRQMWTILGAIAAKDAGVPPFSSIGAAPAAGQAWQRELDYWENVIDEDERAPQPIARGAIRWLRRNPPPPAQRIAVVHGDYRAGNFLFDDEGRIRAILDWEMCHLGDPIEDLAWAMDPVWAGGDAKRPGRLIERARAIAIWEEASGMRADPVALGWWGIFAAVKGLAIWISSSAEFADGRNCDPILLSAGWFMTGAHERLLARRFATMMREART